MASLLVLGAGYIGAALAERALERGALSVRGYDRVLRVAWTVADLAGHAVPGSDDVAEALGLRLQRAAA